MTTPIEPTAAPAQQRLATRQARQAWSALQATNWAALSATQRWEIVRRVLIYVLRDAFAADR